MPTNQQKLERQAKRQLEAYYDTVTRIHKLTKPNARLWSRRQVLQSWGAAKR